MKNILTISLAFFSTVCAYAQTDSIYFLEPTHLEIKNGDVLEEAAPLLSHNKKRIFFTVADKEELNQNGQLRHEIWYSDFYNGQLSDPVKAQKPLNIGLNSAVIGSNENGTRLYLFGAFNKLFENQQTISYTELENGNWKKPISLDIPGLNIDGGFYGFYVHPSEEAIIISQSVNGQEDLFISSKDQSGKWSEPQPLNDMINTEHLEISPFLSDDFQHLYFSRATSGKCADIYVSKRCGSSLLDWSEPVKLPAPINSTGFDAYFTIDADSTITFSSNRNGSADIFISKLMVETKTEFPDPVELGAELLQPVQLPGPESLTFDFNEEDTNYMFFAFNSVKISSSYKSMLREVALLMQKDKQLILEVVGHTDYIDNEEYNYGLSDRRALAVSSVLVSFGIDKNRIFPIGYGESLPISNNINEKGRALNRRVELILMRKESVPN